MLTQQHYTNTPLPCPPPPHRADLVPVYSFGETELFKQVVFPEGSMARSLQTTFKKLIGFAPCLFMGQSWGLVPYKRPVTTVGQYPAACHGCDMGLEQHCCQFPHPP